MRNTANTRNRVLIIVGVVGLACVVLAAGAAAAGGAVYALTRGTAWLGELSEGVGLALPSLRAFEEEARIAVAPLVDDEGQTNSTPNSAQVDERGIVIAAVVPDGPAAAAGMRRGDILLELDGQPINSYRALQAALAGLEPGDEVLLQLLHGDDQRDLTAILDERDGKAFLGVAPCCPASSDDPLTSIPQRIPMSGALITMVVEGSPADEAGLREGDFILTVDGERLGPELSLGDAIAASQPGDRVTLTVRSSGADEERELMVELGVHPEEGGLAYLGVTYLPVPAGQWRRFSLPRQPIPDEEGMVPDLEPFRKVVPETLVGVVVIEVRADSPAAEAGLQEDDVILSMGGASVMMPRDVVEAVTGREPGDELTLTIRRPSGEDQDEELELSVVLGEHPEDEGRAYLGVRVGMSRFRWRRFGGEGAPGGWRFKFDLPEDWESPFDGLELPPRFEFECPPGDGRRFLPGDQGA